MNTTNEKYTVILSAYDMALTEVQNLINTEALASQLTHLEDVTRAVGVFQGQCEQSFIIHTNSSNVVDALKRIAWHYDQQCVLVSNNRRKAIRLYYSDSAPEIIGERFAKNSKLAGNGLLSYTIIDGEYWEVI